jgi:hypothetical protein
MGGCGFYHAILEMNFTAIREIYGPQKLPLYGTLLTSNKLKIEG